MPKQPNEAAITSSIILLHGYREPNPTAAAQLFRSSELWRRVARIQRRLGHGISTNDWLRVPQCCGVRP